MSTIEAGKAAANGRSYGDCAEGFHFDENGMLVPDDETDHDSPP